MAVATRPDPQTCTTDELAAYWAENADELTATDSWLYRAKRRLAETVRDQGPILTPSGRLYLKASGSYEYPPEIAQEFPGLGSHVVSATVDTLVEAERLLSLVTEEVPAAAVDHSIKVDGKRAAALISQGGDAAHRILDLRQPKYPKLAVE